MRARSTTFRGRPEQVDAGIGFVRDEVLPAVTAMDGCLGMSLLVDRSHGACVGTTAWVDEAALRAAEPSLRRLPERGEEVFAVPPEVRVWEIAVLHRVRPAPQGACARVTWTRVDPVGVDQQLYVFRVGTLPQIEDLPGFCSASLLVDRATGRAALAAVYESRAALEATRQAAADVRAKTAARTGVEVLDVAELEVAIARLRVPETV